jgi:hypothetical protein
MSSPHGEINLTSLGCRHDSPRTAGRRINAFEFALAVAKRAVDI